MAACAENLTPVVIEAGGKDALIVDEDADLTKAAEAALWGGMSNAGQTCIGVERVYVHERVYDAFLDELTEQAKDLRAGADPTPRSGPITMPSQLDIIKSHIDDALAKGATRRARRRGRGRRALRAADDPDRRARGLHRRSPRRPSGPTLAINPVETWTRRSSSPTPRRTASAARCSPRSNGVEIARRIRSGMTSVNSVISFAGVPALPFGGVGDSGFGRIHGPDGLKEFTYAKAITRQRFKPLMR